MTEMSSQRPGSRLVLASASASRASMLANAGLMFTVDPSSIDEHVLRTVLSREGAAVERVAERLAEEKACEVSGRNPGTLVLGADQMLECEGRWFDKPFDSVEALNQLKSLRGRTHHLITSAVVVKDGGIVWRHAERAAMSMRDVSDNFLESYLEQVGEDAFRSVGAYQLEGRGAQLFERVAGDFFVVLGLPLLPLLEFLRRERVIER